VPTRQIHLVSLYLVQDCHSFEYTEFTTMAQKPLSEIIRQAEKHLSQGAIPMILSACSARVILLPGTKKPGGAGSWPGHCNPFMVCVGSAEAKTAGNRPWLAGFKPRKGWP
jgi:hypothetical protein